jgi:hypothetical protein
MKRLLLTALVLGGCAPVAPLPGLPSGKCSTAMLGNLVGRAATAEVISRARHRSGATAVRTIRPGQAVTMDYRDGRLNVNVNDRNLVKSFTCG